jgi:hypothetical protein
VIALGPVTGTGPAATRSLTSDGVAIANLVALTSTFGTPIGFIFPA